MTSPEVPFQPELFSDDIYCFLSFILHLLCFLRALPIIHGGVFFVFNSAQGSKAHTALSTRYTDFRACDERTLLAVDIAFFAVVLIKRSMALARRQHRGRRGYLGSAHGKGLVSVCR